MAAPTISSISPSPGYIGQTITITGTNFIAVPASNTVSIGGKTPAVITATTTQLTLIIPTGTTLGAGSVTVTNSNGTSSGFSYTVDEVQGVGVNATNGMWLDNNGIYLGSSAAIRVTIGSGVTGWGSYQNNGWFGEPWPQNVFILSRAFWSKFTGNPAGGQIWPVLGIGTSGGQINPN